MTYDEDVNGKRLLHTLEHGLALLRLEDTENRVGVAVVEGHARNLLLDKGALSASLVVCMGMERVSTSPALEQQHTCTHSGKCA